MQKLRDLRLEKGMTQCDLAKIAGVKQPQISLWERNETMPSMKSIQKIARALGVNPATLF